MTAEKIVWLDAGKKPFPLNGRDWLRVPLDIRARRCKLRGELAARIAPARLSDLVPAARAMSDRVIEQVCRSLAREGQPVQCAAGCSACCELYLVPVSPPEADRMLEEVEQLPPEQQAMLARRFLDATHKVRTAKPFLSPPDPAKVPEALGRWWSSLGIGCPYLQEHRCSIYAQRPLSCREFISNAAAKHCADLESAVQAVPLAVSPAEALYELTAQMTGELPESLAVPLIPNRLGDSQADRQYPAPLLANAFARILGEQAVGNARSDSELRAA